MEILFVLLVIALVVSFAVPAIRSVRYDVYNSRAKAALKKLAEARRSYYQQTKGSDISGGFGGSVAESYASYTCQDVAPAVFRELVQTVMFPSYLPAVFWTGGILWICLITLSCAAPAVRSVRSPALL